MKLLYLMICLTFFVTNSLCKQQFPLLNKNANKTSPVSVIKPSIHLPSNTTNSFLSLIDFLKRFFVALYEQNLTHILNMINCIHNNMKIAKFFLILAIESLKKLEIINFFKMMQRVWEISISAPWC